MMEGFAAQVEGKVAPPDGEGLQPRRLEALVQGRRTGGQTAMENIEELISTAAVYDQTRRRPRRWWTTSSRSRCSATPTRTTRPAGKSP